MSERDWVAVGPPKSKDRSLRQLLRGVVYTRKRLVGCQAAIAGKPAPTVKSGVHPPLTTQQAER
jgi:hypothetical protein